MMQQVLSAFFHDVWPRIPYHSQIVTHLAKRFTAGSTIDDAVELGKKLNAQGFHCDFNYIGDMTDSDAAINLTYQTYASLIKQIKLNGLDAGISVKLSQCGLLDRSSAISDRFAQFNTLVVENARKYGVRLWVDREEFRLTAQTNTILKKLAVGGPVGSVIQAHVLTSPSLVRDLPQKSIAWRVCKGAYDESDGVAYHKAVDINRNFQSIVENLVSAGTYVQIATHDRRLIDYFIKRGHPKSSFEFAMLCGVDMKQARKLQAAGYRVTLYVPFGTDVEGYVIRRIIAKPQYIFLPVTSALK